MLSQLVTACQLPYIKPKYRLIEINKCMINGCLNNACGNGSGSHMDYAQCSLPPGQWIFCSEHSHFGYESAAKELVCNMYAPPNSYDGKTMKIKYDDQIIEATIRGFRISRTKYPSDPIIILVDAKYNVYNYPLDEYIMSQLKSLRLEVNKEVLSDYDCQINKEYFKHAPQILLDRFPQFIIESASIQGPCNDQADSIMTD